MDAIHPIGHPSVLATLDPDLEDRLAPVLAVIRTAARGSGFHGALPADAGVAGREVGPLSGATAVGR